MSGQRDKTPDARKGGGSDSPHGAVRKEDRVQPELALKAFGERLRSLRVERGLSQEQLAGRCGLTRMSISLMERGRSSPNLAAIARLGKGLEADVVPLIDGLPHIKVSSSDDEPPRA